MNRPDPKNYYPKQFINGDYEQALEQYIDFLEKTIYQTKDCDYTHHNSDIDYYGRCTECEKYTKI
jgi:hypothetical protein